MKDRIYILGGYLTDFALNYTRLGRRNDMRVVRNGQFHTIIKP